MNGKSSGGEQLAEEQTKQGKRLSRKEKLGLATKAVPHKVVEKHVQTWMPTTGRKK